MYGFRVGYCISIDQIRTHKDIPGWAFVLLGRMVKPRTPIFEVNPGGKLVPRGRNEIEIGPLVDFDVAHWNVRALQAQEPRDDGLAS